MWRALLFAVGTMLIILGLECLVAESFVVHGARIPAFAAKILDETSKTPGEQLANNGASGFGPSRFDSKYQPSNYSQFNLTGYGKQANQGTQQNGQVRPQTRVLTPKDWMPWSLLAAGTLVVLYTNSTAGGRGFSGD